jgi:SH3 domain protein
MRIKVIVLLTAALLSGPLAAAKTFYVTDRVLLGIYKEKSQDSEVIKVLPSATPLEILERDNTFARVRTPDGIEGWVDAAYLISDKPAQLKVLEITDKHRQAVSALEASEAKITALEAEVKKQQAEGAPAAASSDDSAELKKLTSSNQALEKTNKELQDKLAKLGDDLDAARKTAAASKTELDKLKAVQTTTAAQNAGDDAALKAVQDEVAKLKTQISEEQASTAALQKKHTELTAQYASLQQRLSTAVSALTGQAAPAAGGAAPTVVMAAPAAANGGGISWKWFLIGLGCVLVAGLALGAWLMDRRYLSRHGGFRI